MSFFREREILLKRYLLGNSPNPARNIFDCNIMILTAFVILYLFIRWLVLNGYFQGNNYLVNEKGKITTTYEVITRNRELEYMFVSLTLMFFVFNYTCFVLQPKLWREMTFGEASVMAFVMIVTSIFWMFFSEVKSLRGSLTKSSYQTWDLPRFVLYGGLFIIYFLGVYWQYRDLPSIEYKRIYILAMGTFLMCLVLATILDIGFHLHHSVAGIILPLFFPLGNFTGLLIRGFLFGLFLHGAASYNIAIEDLIS
jgi:hypothetical protein